MICASENCKFAGYYQPVVVYSDLEVPNRVFQMYMEQLHFCTKCKQKIVVQTMFEDAAWERLTAALRKAGKPDPVLKWKKFNA